MADLPSKSSRLRFRPPRVEAPDEIAWLLQAAFSSEFPRSPPADRVTRVMELARRLRLGAAIGARCRALPDSQQLPAPLAEAFRRDQAHAAIRTAMLERSAGQVAEAAARLSVPIVFLKGFALFLIGRDRAGGRPIADLDLLAPEAEAKSLHGELLRNDYRALGDLGNEHHLAALVSPEGNNIDIHFCLRGLSLEESSWATWQDLAQRDLLEAVPDYAGDCTIPQPGALTAHLVVHGLSHHIWRPHSYPLLLLIADLVELLPDAAAWTQFEAEWRPILLRSVQANDLDALRGLTLALSAGRVPNLETARGEPIGVLLGHMLAGYLNPSYGRRLRLRHALDRMGDAIRQGRLLHYLARKVGLERLN